MSNLNTTEDKINVLGGVVTLGGDVVPAKKTLSSPTKYRYRHVFTVTRRHEEKQTLSEIRDDMNCMADEAGEYLYGGVGTHEKIDVATEIWDKPNKRWIPMT